MFPSVFGVVLIVVGLYWSIRQEVLIGIEGKQPLFIVKGLSAIVLGLIVAVLGILVILYPDLMSDFSFYRD